jgi:hypothetical protein
MPWPFIAFDLTDKDFAPVIRSHEITLEVARTPGLVALLNELHHSGGLRQEIGENPEAVLRRRGMAIPNRGYVRMREFKNGGWELSITITEGGYTFINGFSTEAGFFNLHHPELV